MKPLMLTYKGRTQCLRDWSLELGMSPRVLRKRMNEYHWPIDKAFETPLGVTVGKRQWEQLTRGRPESSEPWTFTRLLHHFPKVARLAPKPNAR